MIFAGYEPGSKAYRVFDPASRRVRITRDVVFEESAQWNWSDQDAQGMTTLDDTFTVEYLSMPGVGIAPTATTSVAATSGGAVARNDVTTPTPGPHAPDATRYPRQVKGKNGAEIMKLPLVGHGRRPLAAACRLPRHGHGWSKSPGKPPSSPPSSPPFGILNAHEFFVGQHVVVDSMVAAPGDAHAAAGDGPMRLVDVFYGDVIIRELQPTPEPAGVGDKE
ncbi:hypothetical protein E2562_003057 [Oryza meyeriana var. granulata]|uniref:Retroviral polymerase SH3-like domain-containing protein n=1 Tax=Oryza meyeriana var. granulata TaxID=110450 RepID=A0A6G1DDD5_9ORYZ|nr:hypothetical protein E2562_003057 [Oryza meyeriana var. granulata]